MKKVRLKDWEIEAIKEAIKNVDKDAKIILFGSRVDLTKKGGDIDLLIFSKKIDLKGKLKILKNLKRKLGDRKIDLIITDDIHKSAFYELAYEEGVEL